MLRYFGEDALCSEVSVPLIRWHCLCWGAIFRTAQCVNKLFKNVTFLWYFGNHICICHYNTGSDTKRGDNLLVHSSQDAYDESQKTYHQSMFIFIELNWITIVNNSMVWSWGSRHTKLSSFSSQFWLILG